MLVRELPRFSQPGHCIMFPGRRRDDRGFYLFDQVLDGLNGDIHIGISGEGLRAIASKHGTQFGLALREDLDEANRTIDALSAELAEANARLAKLEDFKEHLAGVAAEGFQIRRRQGRPARKEGDD